MGFGFSSDTKIELRLRDVLIKEKIPFQEQYRIYKKGDLNPKYVVDFYIEFNQKDLIIECDGFSYHTSDFDIERDIKRERWLKENGYKNILRFTTNQIIYEIHIVIRRIKDKLGIKKYSKQLMDALFQSGLNLIMKVSRVQSKNYLQEKSLMSL